MNTSNINCLSELSPPVEISRPSSYWHWAQWTLMPAPRTHEPSTSDLNWTMTQVSPMRQSCGCVDSVLTVVGLQKLSEKWQLPPPPWHHQASEPSSQLSDGSGRTRPTLKPHRENSINVWHLTSHTFTNKEQIWCYRLANGMTIIELSVCQMLQWFHSQYNQCGKASQIQTARW